MKMCQVCHCINRVMEVIVEVVTSLLKCKMRFKLIQIMVENQKSCHPTSFTLYFNVLPGDTVIKTIDLVIP